jgi:hypothetical protein
MDGGVEQPLVPALDALAVAGILLAVGDYVRMTNAFAIMSGIKAVLSQFLSEARWGMISFGQYIRTCFPTR